MLRVARLPSYLLCRGFFYTRLSPAFIVCRFVRTPNLKGGVWFLIVWHSKNVNPAVIRDAEHLGMWWFGFCIVLFYSLKGVWKISLSSWLPESPLCLEFLSAEPTPGNGPRVAVIHNTPGHLNVSLKLLSKNEDHGIQSHHFLVNR